MKTKEYESWWENSDEITKRLIAAVVERLEILGYNKRQLQMVIGLIFNVAESGSIDLSGIIEELKGLGFEQSNGKERKKERKKEIIQANKIREIP